MIFRSDAFRYFYAAQARNYGVPLGSAINGYVEDIELSVYNDPKNLIESMLEDITLYKDIPLNAATILVISGSGEEDLADMFLKSDYDCYNQHR